MDKEKTIRIQPKELENIILPYPYFINEKATVGRQDFWKGKPYKLKLIGFSKEPIAGTMELSFMKFWKNPKKAIGMYPIFSDKKGDWYTEQNQIESVN